MNNHKKKAKPDNPAKTQNQPIQAKNQADNKKVLSWESVQRLISIILMCAQIIGIILTYSTLQEMKEERNSSYRPTLVFDPSYYVVNYSDSPGDLSLINDSIQEEFGHFKDFEDYPISQIYYDNSNESMCYARIPLKCTNVGVGPATDIRIWVEEENIKAVLNEIDQRWHYTSYEIIHYDDPIHVVDEVVFSYKKRINLENEEAEEDDDLFIEEEKYTIKNDYHMNCIHYSSKEYAVNIQYLLANAENTQSFRLPMIYSCLAYALYGEYQATWADDGFVKIYDIDSWNPYLPVIPDLPIKISYYDAENTYHVGDYYITTTLMKFGNPNLLFNVSIIPKSDSSR